VGISSSVFTVLFLALTMERLFSPCTRLHDLLIQKQEDDPVHHEMPDYSLGPVKELNLDVSTEEFFERG
jgi:hypothetical protein